MKLSVLLPSVTLVLMFLFEKGFSLNCYVCNSFLKPVCEHANQLTSENMADCGTNATACRKIFLEYDVKGYTHWRTIRQCSYEQEPPLSCISRTGTYRYKVSYCHCDGENCNSAGTMGISALLITLTLGFVHFATKHL